MSPTQEKQYEIEAKDFSLADFERLCKIAVENDRVNLHHLYMTGPQKAAFSAEVVKTNPRSYQFFVEGATPETTMGVTVSQIVNPASESVVQVDLYPDGYVVSPDVIMAVGTVTEN